MAERIANMLPANHVGVEWALGNAEEEISDSALDDLGDSSCKRQVLSFMQPKRKDR